MRLKQTGSLLLASAMMVGTIGMVNPAQVQAAAPAPTNQYTLTVPAETTLAYDGSAEKLTNGLKVSGGDLEDGKKVTVTASSANEWKLKGSKATTTTTIAYGLYAASDATETTTSWDFDKTASASDGTTVDIYSKITANDYKNATADDYSDTITFTAELVNDIVEVEYTLTGTNANSKVLKSSDLLAVTDTSTFTSGGITYTAYNGYIKETALANHSDAMTFIEELNKVKIDGRTGGWLLLSSSDMAYDWWNSTDSADNLGKTEFDGVRMIWSSVLDMGNDYKIWDCSMASMNSSAAWTYNPGNTSKANCGFVVLRSNTIPE